MYYMSIMSFMSFFTPVLYWKNIFFMVCVYMPSEKKNFSRDGEYRKTHETHETHEKTKIYFFTKYYSVFALCILYTIFGRA